MHVLLAVEIGSAVQGQECIQREASCRIEQADTRRHAATHSEQRRGSSGTTAASLILLHARSRSEDSDGTAKVHRAAAPRAQEAERSIGANTFHFSFSEDDEEFRSAVRAGHWQALIAGKVCQMAPAVSGSTPAGAEICICTRAVVHRASFGIEGSVATDPSNINSCKPWQLKHRTSGSRHQASGTCGGQEWAHAPCCCILQSLHAEICSAHLQLCVQRVCHCMLCCSRWKVPTCQN